MLAGSWCCPCIVTTSLRAQAACQRRCGSGSRHTTCGDARCYVRRGGLHNGYCTSSPLCVHACSTPLPLGASGVAGIHLGVNGSIVPTHFDYPAPGASVLHAIGSKRWELYPTLDWAHAPAIVTVHAGEVLFVPHSWCVGCCVCVDVCVSMCVSVCRESK